MEILMVQVIQNIFRQYQDMQDKLLSFFYKFPTNKLCVCIKKMNFLTFVFCCLSIFLQYVKEFSKNHIENHISDKT